MFKPKFRILASALLAFSIQPTMGSDPKTEPLDTGAKQTVAVAPPGSDGESLVLIETLVRQLKDDDYSKRQEALTKLCRIGPMALPKLQKALHEGQTTGTSWYIGECIALIQDDQLLAYLDRRSDNAGALKRIDVLIQQLGDKDFSKRQEASLQLILLGPVGLPKLIAAQKSDDAEAARRAKVCIEKIEKETEEIGSPTAVVRRILDQRPAGAIEALMRFLPNAGDDALEETIRLGLCALADPEKTADYDYFKLTRSSSSQQLQAKQNQVDAALLQFLRDKVSVRRAMAGLLVGRFGNDEQKTAARKLLDDTDAEVRLRTAQGLLAAKDERGMPTLIDLLTKGDIGQSWQAEELLRWAADDGSPKETISGGSQVARESCRKAWLAWWQKQEGQLNLRGKPENWKRPGLVLLCDPGSDNTDGLVWLTGCDGTTRCKWSGLRRPVEARLIPGPRVLIAESSGFIANPTRIALHGTVSGGRVTERDPAGEVCWEYKGVSNPAVCCRLSNGNIFVASQDMKGGEVSRDGKLVLSLAEFKSIDVKVHKYPSCTSHGTLLYTALTEDARILGVTEFDWTTGAIRTWTTDHPGFPPIKALPSFAIDDLEPDRFLLSGTQSGVVMEVEDRGTTDKDGKPALSALWMAEVPNSTHASRSATGLTLVTTPGSVVTLSPSGTNGVGSGEVVAELFCERHPHRVRSCFDQVRLGFSFSTGIDSSAVLTRLRVSGLRDPEVWRRRRAAELLSSMGRRAVGAIYALKQALADPDEMVRHFSKDALLKIGAAESEVAHTKNSDPKKRLEAIRQLYECCKDDNRALDNVFAPTLLESLNDENSEVRALAVLFAAYPGSDADQLVPALVRALNDRDGSVRVNATRALGSLGVRATNAMPVLLKLLRGEDDYLKQCIAREIGEIGAVNEEVVPALRQALKDKPNICSNAAWALSMIGPRAKDAIPDILMALNRVNCVEPNSAEVRVDCGKIRPRLVQALGNFGADGAQAVPALINILKDDKESRDIKIDAIVALGQVGPAAQLALSEIEKFTRCPGPVGNVASKSLNRIRVNR